MLICAKAHVAGWRVGVRQRGNSKIHWLTPFPVYDANGARTNKTVTTAAGTVSTGYTYDEDNRLISVAGGGDPGASAHAFKYDYRSRRYHRTTPNEETFHVFDGGLAVQEYEGSNGSPQPSALETEFVRGEGMGGGVGGMVYSLKHDAGNLKLVASHSNHRGDVIARTDGTGALQSFALYEAYGTRPYEWGSDPDRQKANTKEEESDLGLLNEGMRYRDLEAGVFLTRDPIGYGDGPNQYCYVHCNPIMAFDPFGLSTYNPETQELDEDEHLNIYVQGEADAEDATKGLILNYDKEQWGEMLDSAKDGYVTLPGDLKVKVDSFRKHAEVNNIILSDTAKGRSATDALSNGHMSYSEAQQVESEILNKKGSGGDGVKTWAEHWNARKALNRDGDLETLAKANAGMFRNGLNFKLTNQTTGEVWKRADGTKFHGPVADQGLLKAKGVDKWYTDGGRELVFSKGGSFEKRTQFMGTYNFGKKQLPFGAHDKYDIQPWKDRGTSPYE